MNDFKKMKGAWDRLSPFQITSIIDDFDGLNIFIEDNQTGFKKGKFYIDAHRGYRNFDEGDLHSYWLKIGGVKRSGMYKASASSFLDWAIEQCIYKELDPKINHYMIVSVGDVFEVLAFDTPVFISD